MGAHHEDRRHPAATLLGQMLLDELRVATCERDRHDAAASLAAAGRAADAAAALQRLADGTFGRCVRCGSPIPLWRLRARPGVRDCTGCAAAGGRRP
ncbi:TraR/DksA C4-type zinc finger protein [Spirilliplanes yamanashiensis]|uniref:Zinc finger DksA/TraR C4-type domain-containing protein n=1 Tax=Spirilliplanes yamanashiensis TaxID=42233 RepID=A0A8J3YBY9_9ACTN|nr:TraR/DksA C4-type zinc finger protein [Spirilliplanes yamanashiensis]MDP9818156.1 RNA polymerase-binding transcription factor DksA [Spirilliplanes yamanashiensis]GIJ04967.1 hypothetical protein Sya03_43190 [Spirilliplanes yamanashiensis]